MRQVAVMSLFVCATIVWGCDGDSEAPIATTESAACPTNTDCTGAGADPGTGLDPGTGTGGIHLTGRGGAAGGAGEAGTTAGGGTAGSGTAGVGAAGTAGAVAGVGGDTGPAGSAGGAAGGRSGSSGNQASAGHGGDAGTPAAAGGSGGGNSGGRLGSQHVTDAGVASVTEVPPGMDVSGCACGLVRSPAGPAPFAVTVTAAIALAAWRRRRPRRGA